MRKHSLDRWLLTAVLVVLLSSSSSFAAKKDAKKKKKSNKEVTYDGTSLIIDGKRELLYSGSIHYPRSTPEVFIESHNLCFSKTFFFFFCILRLLCHLGLV